MGFLKRIGDKLKKARQIGTKVAHGVAIGLRKGGKAIQKGSQIAGKIAPFLEMIPDPRVKALGESLEVGSKFGKQVGELTADVGRSGSQFLDDGKVGSLLERTKDQKARGENLFKN